MVRMTNARSPAEAVGLASARLTRWGAGSPGGLMGRTRPEARDESSTPKSVGLPREPEVQRGVQHGTHGPVLAHGTTNRSEPVT